MKKLFITIFFSLISNAALAGSCPMLWGKIDSNINNVADKELKVKIQELRDIYQEEWKQVGQRISSSIWCKKV